jgi:hypothetical protein
MAILMQYIMSDLINQATLLIKVETFEAHNISIALIEVSLLV